MDKLNEIYRCRWTNCNELPSDLSKLNAHLKYHIRELCNNPDNCKCEWNNCSYSATCLEDFERHVCYHGYHSTLTLKGKVETEKNKLPKCRIYSNTAFTFPEIESRSSSFQCDWVDCNRTFQSIIEFQDHILQHSWFDYESRKSANIKRPTIVCNWKYCNKKFQNRYRLIEHIRKHSKCKQIGCWNCGQLFSTKSALFDHCLRQPANNTFEFQCLQCLKHFSTEKLLRSHEAKHYNCQKCTMCDMTCTSASALATHVRYRHLKDKPFKCVECKHCCVRKSDLVKHVKLVHKKEMQHCSEAGCNYAVRTHNLLRRHYLEVHAKAPYIYICHCCQKVFKNGKTLSRHLTAVHDIQPPSGHKRFTYRMDESGFYCMETTRIESLDVIEQILTPSTYIAFNKSNDGSDFNIITSSPKEFNQEERNV